MAGPTKSELAAQLRTAQAALARERTKRRRLETGLGDALARQAAAAEILRIISASPSDAQPVFDAIVQSAARLFGRKAGLRIVEPDGLRRRARSYADEGEFHGADVMPIDRSSLVGRAVLEGKAMQIVDTLAPRATPYARANAGKLAYRSLASAPLLRDGKAIGALSVSSPEPGAMSDEEMALLSTFADQAVIAIENARRFNETQEALEQQTRTAEILKVIARTPSDVQPVFDSIAESAHRLLNDAEVGVTLIRGDRIELVAAAGLDKERVEALRATFPRPLDLNSGVNLTVVHGQTVHYPDVTAKDVPSYTRDTVRAVGIRAMLGVPLLREGKSIGGVFVSKTTPGAYTEKQIALLRTFADQAVIAIQNARLFNETKEALERQTATADILKVIAGSPADVQPVFDAIAHSAIRLVGGHSCSVTRVLDDHLHLVALTSTDPAGDEFVRTFYPMRLDGQHPMLDVVRTARTLLVRDTETDPVYGETGRQVARARGFRTIAYVPMLREGTVTGVIHLAGVQPNSLTDSHVRMLHTFADQAVIAIENVRLFNETKEALEQQRASAEVLNVISNSVSDAQPVFEKIVESCERIFATSRVGLNVIGPDGLVHAGAYGKFPGAETLRRENFPHPCAGSATGAAISAGALIHYPDALGDANVPQYARRGAETVGFRAFIMAPLLSEGRGLGAIFVGRETVGSFSEKERALLKTFADQAAVAIENARLFNETKEALERQTATSEILKVIARSPSDVQPVFDAIAQSAYRLIGGFSTAVARVFDNVLHLVAFSSTGEAGNEALKSAFPMPVARSKAAGTGRPVCITDTEALPDSAASLRELARVRGFRSIVIVPMLRDGVATGTISVTRREPGVFTDHQVDLLKTFADQAVIAIENVRLFKELESRTEALSKSVRQLTALGEVGQAISSTLDLETVLKSIVQRAVQLTGVNGGTIYEFDERAGEFYLRAAENMSDELADVYRRMPIRLGEGIVGGAAAKREPQQVPDIQDPGYQTRYRDQLIRQGYRALLAVPLLRNEQIIGALTVNRNSPGEFAADVVELLKTFATQSALAIQNARLFREIADKGRQLEEASRHKSQFLASMSHELRTPLNAILGFNELILGGIYGEVPADMQGPLADIQSSGKHLLRLINNVLDLAKIEAGRMELALAEYSVHDTVETVRSTLRPLAAEKGLEFAVTLPEDIPLAYGDSGRITQCLVNLAGNSLKFTKSGKVEIAVEHRGELLKFSVTDTGIGIAPDKIGGLFSEFKQTDATIASEYGGSGLGLSIVKKFVEMHGGRIWVESEPGKGSTFAFEIPLRAQEKTP